MSPAELVIARFGGIRPLARLLGCEPSTVLRWKEPPEKGGTGGMIPAGRMQRLLELAREHRVELTPNDLVLGCNGPAEGESTPADGAST